MTDERTQDELLQSLGRHARERQKREALRPLSEDFQRRMADQIKLAVTDDAGEEKEDSAPAAPRTRPAPWLALAASVLAAVGLTVTLVSRDPATALPGYSLEFRGGAQVRSGDAVAPLQMGDRLDVVLRPDVTTQLPLAVTVYRQQDSALAPVDVDVRWSDEGAARVTATLDTTLGIAPGPQSWLFVVAHEGDAPTPRALRRLDDDARGEGWQAFRVSFELVP